MYLGPEKVENGGLIPRTRSNLQHLVSGNDFQKFCLKRNGIGLGYGLPFSYRESLILIGVGMKGTVKEKMPGKDIDCIQYSLVVYALFLNGLNQRFSLAFMNITVL